MNAHNAQERLLEAKANLDRALQRLNVLRRAALYGRYDPAEFDEAVMAYRQAEREAQAAREALALAGVARGGTAIAAPAGFQDEPSTPMQPTPRLLFARWLVETGRLSDWR